MCVTHEQTTRQKILISGGLAVGGPQTHVTILCKVLREAGAEVTIAASATNWPRVEIKSLKASGIRVVVSPFGFGQWRHLGKPFSFLLWPFLLRRDYDVVYCIGEGRMHLFASRFARKGGKKIYHEIVECPKPGSVAAQVASKMTHLIGNSRLIARQMAVLWPETPIEVIPFLTSTETLPPPDPKLIPADHILRIAFLGRIVSHKRPDRLVEEWPSFEMIPGFHPARLDIYGGDYGEPMIDNLRERVRQMGFEDKIIVHGAYPIEDLPRILEQTDLVVLPSLYEGLPLVLVEAMLRGVPIVATSAGGCEELGDGNVDVIITTGTEWEVFVAGLTVMTARLRAGEIDARRLNRWAESNYGFLKVSQSWHDSLVGASVSKYSK